MRELKEYLDNNVAMRLNNFKFDRIDIADEDIQKICVDDSFEISDVEEKMFSILLKRHIYCIPESIMDICVEFEIARNIADEYDMSLENFDLDKEITEKNIDEYIDNNFNRVSALVSSVTSGFGLNPLITPPVFIREEY